VIAARTTTLIAIPANAAGDPRTHRTSDTSAESAVSGIAHEAFLADAKGGDQEPTHREQPEDADNARAFASQLDPAPNCCGRVGEALDLGDPPRHDEAD
jgi:hypothetical protein